MKNKQRTQKHIFRRALPSAFISLRACARTLPSVKTPHTHNKSATGQYRRARSRNLPKNVSRTARISAAAPQMRACDPSSCQITGCCAATSGAPTTSADTQAAPRRHRSRRCRCRCRSGRRPRSSIRASCTREPGCRRRQGCTRHRVNESASASPTNTIIVYTLYEEIHQRPSTPTYSPGNMPTIITLPNPTRVMTSFSTDGAKSTVKKRPVLHTT